MQQNQNQIENQIPYTHSVKLETTAKGIRPHVHVYANSEDEIIATARRTYERIVADLKENGFTIAPINGQTD